MEPDEFMQEDKDRGGGEDEGMEQHKSVIMHLIKQVRIGMDLTKGLTNLISELTIKNSRSADIHSRATVPT